MISNNLNEFSSSKDTIIKFHLVINLFNFKFTVKTRYLLVIKNKSK